MAYVTLEALKQHLRVEYTADDSYLTTLIDVAEAAIGNELGKPLANFAADGTFMPSSCCAVTCTTIEKAWPLRLRMKCHALSNTCCSLIRSTMCCACLHWM